MNPVENYILNQPEPFQSIMLYVRSVIFKTLPLVAEKYSYKIPCYYYSNKPLCYINVLKGKDYVDVAFVQGVFLEDKYVELKDGSNRKQVRSIQVKSLEDFDESMFVALLNDASIHLDKSNRAWNP